jgi:F-type H+-transporting ATPase subunit b
MKKLIVLFALLASPALAETEEAFFSLKNTEFIVLLAFLLFVAILVWQ